MTCKDCLHYEACKGTYFALEERIIDKDSFDNEHYADIYACPDFTNRSEWMHLPCKVGDKLYEITSRKTISEYQVTAIRIELFGILLTGKIRKGLLIDTFPICQQAKSEKLSSLPMKKLKRR